MDDLLSSLTKFLGLVEKSDTSQTGLLEQTLEQDEEREQNEVWNEEEDCAISLLGDESLTPETRSSGGKIELFENILALSSNAWAKSTLSGYESQIKLFSSFTKEQLPTLYDSIENPDKNTPLLICAWIGFHCETPNRKANSRLERESLGKTYTHAEKMRSAVSFYYNYQLKRGKQSFLQSQSGLWIGNPVYSDEVARYLKSLKRRKAQLGERPMSVRAITIANLQALYERNAECPPNSHLKRLSSTEAGERPWAGPRRRLMMSLVYAISFLCFLRIDETLRIESRHIRVMDKQKGKFELILDFRKTAQHGEIKPFVFYFDRENPWIDASTLLLEWIHISNIKEGYIFRPFNAFDCPAPENKAMSQSVFLDAFRTNLDEIGQDAEFFGGHSFRRGGVQYFSVEKRWPLRKLCDWGGWSYELDNMTIIRYLIGSNDEPMLSREGFLDPEPRLALQCSTCGRTCNCGGQF